MFSYVLDDERHVTGRHTHTVMTSACWTFSKHVTGRQAVIRENAQEEMFTW